MTTCDQLDLQQSTVDLINEFTEQNYFSEDIYEFIQEYGEGNFVQFYEQYVEFGENYCYEAVDAFIAEFGIHDLNGFEDSYCGKYSSKVEYARDYVESCYSLEVPGFVEVDWEATFDNLDVVMNGPFVFYTQY